MTEDTQLYLNTKKSICLVPFLSMFINSLKFNQKAMIIAKKNIALLMTFIYNSC